ncbi:hypothetical protein PC116_g32367, partial [Phytophthora cactorum]
DTALVKLPIWAYTATLGRVFGTRKPSASTTNDVPYEDENLGDLEDDSSSDQPQRTPSTDSAEDFELLGTSVEDLPSKPKATGSQAQQSNKAKKRNKKR